MKVKRPENIICFALPAWKADYLRSTVELMKIVAEDNLVLYVDYAYTISDCVKGIFGRKAFDWQRLLGIKPRLRRVQGEGETGLYVLSLPPVFPSFIFKTYKYFKVANRLNACLTGYYINLAARKLKMKNIIGFNSFQPFLGRYWKIGGLEFNVYYIYDDFTDIPWFNGFVIEEEKEFLPKVDLIIVSSNELKIRKSQLNKPIEMVNNGVHFDSFFTNINKNRLNGNYIKTIGYTGTMDSRIDIDLLEYVVSQMPDRRFLFVGKVVEQHIHTRLFKYLNVVFEPPVSTDKIPFLQSQVDVGIIPYVCNALTAAIYPLKVNEFLAMGLPVVMTPFASIGEADEVVYVANSPASFKERIEYALFENDASLIEKRLAIAKKADWHQRAAQLMKFVNKHKANESVSINPLLNQAS